MNTNDASGSIGERVKALRAQRASKSLSPPNNDTTGENRRLQDSSSTPVSHKRKSRDHESGSEPRPRKKRTVWSQGYNEDSDGAESEADLSLATKPNIRRKPGTKAKEADSSTAASTTESSSPKTTNNDDFEEGKILQGTPKKAADTSSAKKRKYVDGPASFSDKKMAPLAKKQKINAKETENNDISTPQTSPSQKSKTRVTRSEDVEKRKKRKADDGPASTSDQATAPSAKKLKTSATTATAPKKAAPLRKTMEEKPLRKTAAAAKKASFITKPTEEAEEVAEREAPKKNELPKEYRNNSHLRGVVDTFCITKGIGFFEDMSLEQQERLLKEMKKRSECVALLDIRKAAVSSRTREENRWKNKGQHDNDSALFVHQRKMNTLQRGVDGADKSIDAWEARNGNISYKLAYDAAVAGKTKKFWIDHATDEGMPGRRSAFFAARLPVEVWEKRVADDCDAADADADSEEASHQKSREDRLQQIKKGKSSAASKTDVANEGINVGTADKE